MIASRMGEHFGTIANAPNGIGALRELILCLAMQGKLVHQNFAEMPANELLAEVEAEKQRLVRKKLLKASTTHPEISVNERPHPIPATWEWVRFGTIALHNSGKTLDQQRNSGQPRDYITTSNLYWGHFDLRSLRQMLIEDDELDRCTAVKGDLLICEGGEAGRAAVWDRDYEVSFQNHVHRARFYAKINPYYAYRFFQKLNATGEINRYRKGVGISSMSGKVLATIVVPLPPLDEQKRIVAKVDELMALCDQLEAQHQERKQRFLVLSRACHARFAKTPTPNNLNRIFDETDAVSPDDLRKTILNLAVQGRIVNQSPSEGTGESILGQIAELKKQTPASQQTKAVRRIREIDAAKCSYDIPKQWAWCRLGDLVLSFRYGTSRKCEPDINGVPVLRIPNIKNGRIDASNLKFTAMPDAEFEELRLLDGDLLLIRSNGSENLVGLSAVVSVDDERFVYAGYLVRARLPADYVFSPYIQKALSTSFVRDQIEGPIRTTSGVKNLNTTELSNLTFPLPPLAEQRRIVARVDELMALVDQLETQQQERDKLAEAFAKACVASVTGRAQLEKHETMKAPKTELVSFVTLGKTPKHDSKAPLAQLLSQHKGTLPAKSLWQQSGLTIEAFYQQLKTEITQGWIAPPAEAKMKVAEEA